MTRKESRARPKWGWKKFPPDRGEKNRIHLSDDQAESLGSILGLYPTNSRWAGFVDHIELVLSSYFTLANAIDNTPRPAHVRAAAETLRAEADAFLGHISAIDDVSGEHLSKLLELYSLLKRNVLLRDALAPSNAAQERFRSLISYLEEEFIPACDGLVNALDSVESRGRPKRQALQITIKLLCGAFDHYFDPNMLEEDPVMQKVPGERPSRRKRFQMDFVSDALDAAGISRPKKDETLARLLPRSEKNMH